MEVQHVNVKIFAREAGAVDLAGAIPVFHRWIREKLCEELLIDVADYRHVPNGPGVMLIGHEANYSLDLTDGRLGLLYNRKKKENGGTQVKLRQVFDAAEAACRRLEREAPFRGKLTFDPFECEVLFNDRLLAPNTPETYQRLAAELREFFRQRWGTGTVHLEHIGEPRERLRVHASGAGGIGAPLLSQAATAPGITLPRPGRL